MEQTVRIASQLGQALWGARKLSSLTQKAVGARVGLLPKTISALERTPEREYRKPPADSVGAGARDGPATERPPPLQDV